MTTFHQLETLAREICDSRNGAGHYDAKGTKRAHWRELAEEMLALPEAASFDPWKVWGTLI